MSKEKDKTIADYIVEFMQGKVVDAEPRFYMETLRAYVQHRSGRIPAPGSVDRILRMLRKEGKANYLAINKLRSLYLALPLTLEEKKFVLGSQASIILK